MAEITLNKIEQVLNDHVRPSLGEHQGDIEVISLNDGVLRVRLLGQCSNCPSAVYTMESLVEAEIKNKFPEIQEVVLVTGVSEETWSMAQSILREKREKRQ